MTNAINYAKSLSWITASSEIIQAQWTSGHTVVGLQSDGSIVSYASSPTPGYEEYGDLTPYALQKAVCALHLRKAAGEGIDGYEEGLSSPQNVKHLRSLKYELHDGATYAHVCGQHIFLGASGCTVNQEYLSGLLGEGATAGPDTFAGSFDSVLVEHTARILNAACGDSSRIPGTVPEPIFAQEMLLVRN